MSPKQTLTSWCHCHHQRYYCAFENEGNSDFSHWKQNWYQELNHFQSWGKIRPNQKIWHSDRYHNTNGGSRSHSRRIYGLHKHFLQTCTHFHSCLKPYQSSDWIVLKGPKQNRKNRKFGRNSIRLFSVHNGSQWWEIHYGCQSMIERRSHFMRSELSARCFQKWALSWAPLNFFVSARWAALIHYFSVLQYIFHLMLKF